MSIHEHGIEATITPDGVLDLKTDRPLRVRLNGRMLNGVTGNNDELGAAQSQLAKQKFWQPDGTQSESTTDLRGEQR